MHGTRFDLPSRVLVARASHRAALAAALLAGALAAAPRPAALSAGVDFCRLQFPSSATVAGGGTTEPVYGRVYAAGLTEPPGASGSVAAELGFGPAGTDPRADGGWAFAPAAFSSQVGNDDEYAASIAAPPAAADTAYAYAYRFALGGGAWAYCDRDGAGGGAPFDPANLGALTVTPGGIDPNRAPAADADAFRAKAGRTLRRDAARGVLANDADPDGDPLTAVLVAGPAKGKLALNPDGSFAYTPPRRFRGAAAFTYEARDGRGGTARATATIAVR